MIDWKEARVRIAVNPYNHYVIDKDVIYSEADNMESTVLNLPCTEDAWRKWLVLNPGIKLAADRALTPRIKRKRADVFSEIMNEGFESFEHRYNYTPTANELWLHIINNADPKWGITSSKDLIVITDDSIDRDTFRHRYKRSFVCGR